jgi:predicted nucleotidyltransferase
MTSKVAARISVPYEQIEQFCRKWNITRFEVFGSVLRDDFDPRRSDVDVLVTFAPGAVIGWDFFALPDELKQIFGRPVDLSTRRSIEQSPNPIRKQAILETAQTLYEKR